jgi:hypothetical protein
MSMTGGTQVLHIAVYSDLHLERVAWRPPTLNADLVVLAGDIAEGTDGIGRG